MRQWANYPQVESSARPLSGVPPAQIPIVHPSLNADDLLAIAGTRTGERLIVRPLGIGLIALALAIVSGGTGYKLSLYRPQPDPSARVSVVKLWVGQRKATYFTSPAKRLALPSPDPQLIAVHKPTSRSGPDIIRVSSPESASNMKARLLLRALRSPPARFL